MENVFIVFGSCGRVRVAIGEELESFGANWRVPENNFVAIQSIG